ncbi:hypothetical protein SAMN05878482_11192 [Peribacillus simplex]|uniref:Uncharacterized protein n=1 Tax=Peribacillus simplex TaxID=1478 RepID=A0A9X8WN44_9BACI|nr:hypothetical protein SAMN05878482_11192 [Peribacillus simplex]
MTLQEVLHFDEFTLYEKDGYYGRKEDRFN